MWRTDHGNKKTQTGIVRTKERMATHSSKIHFLWRAWRNSKDQKSSVLFSRMALSSSMEANRQWVHQFATCWKHAEAKQVRENGHTHCILCFILQYSLHPPAPWWLNWHECALSFFLTLFSHFCSSLTLSPLPLSEPHTVWSFAWSKRKKSTWNSYNFLFLASYDPLKCALHLSAQLFRMTK